MNYRYHQFGFTLIVCTGTGRSTRTGTMCRVWKAAATGSAKEEDSHFPLL